MEKSKFTGQPIIRTVPKIEVAAKVAGACRRHGINAPTCHAWKSKCADMEVPQSLHLKDVQSDLHRLTHTHTDLAMGHCTPGTSPREKSRSGTSNQLSDIFPV